MPTPILFCGTLCQICTHTPILGTGKTVIRAFIAHARLNLSKPCERLAVATVWVACAGLGPMDSHGFSHDVINSHKFSYDVIHSHKFSYDVMDSHGFSWMSHALQDSGIVLLSICLGPLASCILILGCLILLCLLGRLLLWHSWSHRIHGIANRIEMVEHCSPTPCTQEPSTSLRSGARGKMLYLAESA